MRGNSGVVKRSHHRGLGLVAQNAAAQVLPRHGLLLPRRGDEHSGSGPLPHHVPLLEQAHKHVDSDEVGSC